MVVTARPRAASRTFMLARVLGAITALALTPWVLGQSLRADIERAVSAAKLGSSKVGVSVIDTKSGEVLAAVNADDPLMPASNMKILTTGAALFTLGPDFVFRTRFQAQGRTLIVTGDGDPAFGDPEILQHAQPKLTVEDLLSTLAGAVKRAGMDRLDEVIVDDRVFDRERVHPSWPTEQLSRWYCAEVAGVNFHANVLAAFPRPSESGAGRPPTLTTQPSVPWLEIDTSRARTVREGNNTAWLSRAARENRFQLIGNVRAAAETPIETTLFDPPQFFGELLAYNLMRGGIDLGGDEPSQGDSDRPARWRARVRLVQPDEKLNPERTLAVVTTPLADVLRRCNSDSHNMYAEALFKRVSHQVTGEPGSWITGASVMRMLLSEKLGPEFAAETEIGDGSGMSRLNKVAPQTFTRWMRAVVSDPKLAEPYVQSFPRPGEGTLEKRFRGRKIQHEIRGKSGYISGVRCLSGFVIDRTSERIIAFSVMVNYDPRFGQFDSAALKLHEDVCQAIDTWLGRSER